MLMRFFLPQQKSSPSEAELLIRVRCVKFLMPSINMHRAGSRLLGGLESELRLI